MNKSSTFLALAAVVMSASCFAAVTSEQASELGTKLTPLGGEIAGNADGSIPKWDGGIKSPPANYKGSATHHVDPFPADKPLFTITRENMDQYKANLSEGLKALLNAYPQDFRIPVYTSRRTAAAPQWVYDNTKQNATQATLVEEGNGIEKAFAGTPFPIPQNGLEVIWNHLTRYRGTYFVRRYSSAAVQQNGDLSLSTTAQEAFFKYYDPNGSESELNNKFVFFLTTTISPARLAGGAVLVHEALNQVKEPRQAWAYAAGQRRVRRAPNLAYDTPIYGTDGLRTVDDADMFTGAPDRYNWKLLGKKEIYIPYNNYKMSEAGVKYKQLLLPRSVNPDYTRFELHRVWVVEATLKPSARHIYSKRIFYVDEDSWQISMADQYSGRGDLWRVSLAYLKNFYELPAIWSAADVNYDLQARRYYATSIDSEESSTIDFSRPVPKESRFTPSTLRADGVR